MKKRFPQRWLATFSITLAELNGISLAGSLPGRKSLDCTETKKGAVFYLSGKEKGGYSLEDCAVEEEEGNRRKKLNPPT